MVVVEAREGVGKQTEPTHTWAAEACPMPIQAWANLSSSVVALLMHPRGDTHTRAQHSTELKMKVGDITTAAGFYGV
jgi:hypothetical protein